MTLYVYRSIVTIEVYIVSAIKLFHGSQVVVEKPLFGYGKIMNDYGQGFYCTEDIELAKEWACQVNNDGFVNEYDLDTEGLNILNLSSEFNILNWLAILLENRLVRFTTPIQRKAAKYIVDNFMPNYKNYDVIVGYRADDSYFLFARYFVSNQISLNQLKIAMKLGRLGEQYCLKSEKAFSNIKFVGYIEAKSEIYFRLRKEREEKARLDFLKVLESEDAGGLYIRDIISENIKNDDQRLR